MTMEDSSSDDRMIKAPTDRRLYRLLRLPNGLSALLVHDPDVLVDGVQESSSKGEKDENDLEDEADDEEDEDDEEEEDEEEDDDEDDEEENEEGDEDEDEDEDEKEVPLTKKAAAALCVGIGSFSDPFEAQGLAHFLEHMLFMGSSEFPDENEYDSYLSKHGGSSNAYTETEYTCYYFEVNREYLKGALKRFSQFFISPLIKAEAMEREILAVDSEFNQVIQIDGVRLQQLQCHTSYPGHPFNRFFWGNKKSLSDAMERGINLREQILRLYRENYHGGLMKLVVIGGEPLDTLEDWVIELFGSVKEGLHLKVDPQKNIPIWETGKIYRVEAVKDVNVLHLLWTLPPLDKEYLKKPEDYVAHLLGHEGSGSLLFFFKAKGWASSLSAGVGDEGTRKCAVAYIFDMSIHLTESGLEQVNEVVGVVYQYLKLLRQVGPQTWVFKELQDIGNMEFRFAEEQVQDDYAVELAENMLFYSEEHIIYGQYAFQIWDPKLVEHVLSFFTPNNMRIDLLSKSFNKESKGQMLMDDHPTLFWTPCAAHCIDLMLHDICKLPIITTTVKRAIALNGYIYNHPYVLNMMNTFTEQKELIRPGVTRFATVFLTLQSIYNQKNKLRRMFTSEEWSTSRYHRDTKGKDAYETVLSPGFWNNILYSLRATGPLVRVLRMVDSEKKPAMGYIYEAMDRAKEAISKSFNYNEAKYYEIWEIIDKRWNDQLHRPLHAAGYYLNPEYFYTTPRIESNEELNDGFLKTMARLVPDEAIQHLVETELSLYRYARGVMGSPNAIRNRALWSPDIQYEPWFGSPYIVEDIALSLLEIWTDPPEVDPSLHLPSQNEFLPCDFSIRIANPSEIPPNAATNVDHPICLVDEPMMKLWYKPDSIFKVPRANTYFLITVKEGYKDVKNCVLTELFVNLLKDELNEILYQAGLAKLDTSLSIIGDKIELRLYGFNDKLQALLIRILNISKLFSPTADRFKVIKEDMERSYRNFNMKPLSHSSYLRLQVLRLKFWDVDEKLACLTNLSLPDLKSSIPELLSELHIEGLCHGNISVKEVLDISNIFKNTFSVQTLPVEIRHHENILCMPSGSIIMNASVKNKMEVNSVAELYFQIEQDVGVEATRLRAVSDLFDKIVEEPFFNQLRTKEQLGYTVETGPRMTYRVLGFCFIVQSAEYDPIYLHGRIDHFICGLQQLLDNLDVESFENYRTGLIEEKLEKDPSLIHETNHYWNQIVDKRYVFDMLKKEAEELKSIQKSDIINFYNTYLRLGSPKCRVLAIHMWGCKTNMEGEGETQNAFGTIIEDLTAFKGSALFYPSLC